MPLLPSVLNLLEKSEVQEAVITSSQCNFGATLPMSLCQDYCTMNQRTADCVHTKSDTMAKTARPPLIHLAMTFAADLSCAWSWARENSLAATFAVMLQLPIVIWHLRVSPYVNYEIHSHSLPPHNSACFRFTYGCSLMEVCDSEKTPYQNESFWRTSKIFWLVIKA